MIRIISKLLNRFLKLDRIRKIIIIMLLVIVILLIATSVLKSNLEEEEKWSYGNSSISESVLQKGTVEKNRIIYWELSNIIDKYISTVVLTDDSDDTNISYEDFYAIITKNYRKDLDRKKYNKLAKSFIHRFVYETPGNSEAYNTMDYSIKKIYSYGNNMYLCYVSVNTEDVDQDILDIYYKNNNEDIVRDIKKDGYIGIKLNKTDTSYEIFYIE